MAGETRRRRRMLVEVRSRLPVGRGALPTFLVVGAMKSGTSSLYQWLVGHPGAARALYKETRFFNRGWDRGPDFYRAHFPPEVVLGRLARRRRHPVVTGESTPAYLPHPHVPGRVREVLPDARIVVLLRDPVARAFSHYGHLVDRERERRPFGELVDAELGAIDAAGGTWERAWVWHRHGPIARGLYAEQLVRWFEAFGREQVHVELSDDLFGDPERCCERVASFIGLPPRAELRALERRNVGTEATLDDATRRRLAAFFEGPNRELAELLGRELPW